MTKLLIFLFLPLATAWSQVDIKAAVAPVNPCTSGGTWVRTDTGVRYACLHGLWIGDDATSVNVKEDWIGGSVGTTGSAGQIGWLFGGITGTCAEANYASASTTHPGVWAVSSSAVSTQGCSVWLGSSTPAGILGAIGNSAFWWSQWIAGISTTSTIAWRIGFGTSQNLSAIPTNGIYFRYDTSLGTPDTTIMACIDVSSTETCTSTGQTPVAATFYDLYINSNVAATITYQVGSNAAVTICASGCTATGTPPSGLLSPTALVVTETTAVESMFLDYWQYLSSGLVR